MIMIVSVGLHEDLLSESAHTETDRERGVA